MSAASQEAIPAIRQIGRASLRATLVVRTGLHIGAGKDEIEIGGIDNPVVKTPQGDPYVPGSSIKGKLRFLMEWAFGTIDQNTFGPWPGPKGDNGRKMRAETAVPRIFGTSADAADWLAGPTRLLVRDAHLDQAWREEWLKAGRELTEMKTEVGIDRIAGKAADGRLHVAERVPPGARFGFDAAYRVYELDGDGGEGDLRGLAWVIQGLDLLEQDALGGSGSRGYGQVAFEGLELAGPAQTVALDNIRKGHPFGTDAPAPEILAAVRRAFGKG